LNHGVIKGNDITYPDLGDGTGFLSLNLGGGMTTRRAMFLGLAAVVLVGCAAHRYTVKNETVTFSLRMPGAEHVAICSSLDGFRPRAAVQTSRGVWEAAFSANTAFAYFYLVDDAVIVPDCTLSEDDGFGARNCIFDPQL